MHPQNVCNSNLHQVVQQDDSVGHEVMEVIGELDPQTGIYSIHQPAAAATAGNLLYTMHVCLWKDWIALLCLLQIVSKAF
jgi:hypothetical protein